LELKSDKEKRLEKWYKMVKNGFKKI